MDQSESELLTLLATDLHRHFKQVVLGYQHRLYAFARRLTASSQDAEDIVQETFVSAYVSLENYPAPRIQTLKLKAWLYRILLNVYNHHTRGAQLHLVSLNLAEESEALAIEDRDDERPEVVFENQERRQELEALIARLPERYRVAVTCYYFEHLNYQEVAELLDQPVGTVKSTVSRGIRLLRAMLDIQKQERRERDLWSLMKPNDRKA
jgi:RNA polymerase sigma-70 factor (ECF subfamily)